MIDATPTQTPEQAQAAAARDAYNLELFAIGERLAAEPLADRLQTVRLMLSVGSAPGTDGTIDRLREDLIAGGHATDADLPAVVPTRHRKTVVLETDANDVATVQLTEGGTAPHHLHYPKVDSYTWGAFAYLAIEAGGYGDLEVVNPHNGERLWIGNALGGQDELVDGAGLSPYDALRRVIDAMERHSFLG